MTGAARRRAELAANLGEVRQRIDRACAAAGRDPAGVTLVAVTKTWPAADVRLLQGLGLTDFGENRDQEARQKATELPDARWHFVGTLQRNKASSVAGYADLVQSVDRPGLVTALGAGARSAGRVVSALVQVSLDPQPGRGGAPPAAVGELADLVAAEPGLQLAGLMLVAPLGADPAASFGRLAELATEVRQQHPTAIVLSAGMSGDLEPAIAAGSTLVRVGTALLGPRTTLLR